MQSQLTSKELDNGFLHCTLLPISIWIVHCQGEFSFLEDWAKLSLVSGICYEWTYTHCSTSNWCFLFFSKPCWALYITLETRLTEWLTDWPMINMGKCMYTLFKTEQITCQVLILFPFWLYWYISHFAKHKWKCYATETKWDITCIFHVYGFLLFYQKCNFTFSPYLWNIQVISHISMLHHLWYKITDFLFCHPVIWEMVSVYPTHCTLPPPHTHTHLR